MSLGWGVLVLLPICLSGKGCSRRGSRFMPVQVGGVFSGDLVRVCAAGLVPMYKEPPKPL